MPRFNFNEWRENYDTYSFEQHKELNNILEEISPRQQQHNTEEVINFLKDIPNAKVLELGGWKGELANKVLLTNKDIILWHNYDICSNAIDKNVCKDERFKGIVLTDFAWNLDIFSGYNVCIMSHVVEHMKLYEFKSFLDKIKHIKYIYIDCPLNDPYNRMKWKNYCGTHILNAEWSDITKALKGYNETIIIDTPRNVWQKIVKPDRPSNIRIYRLK